MRLGIATNLGHPLGRLLLKQFLLNELFRVGIDSHSLTETFQLPHPLQQILYVVNRLSSQCLGNGRGFRIKRCGHEQPECEVACIIHGHAERRPLVRFLHVAGGKRLSYLVERVQDVLAGPQRIDAIVRAGTVRISTCGTTQGDAIRLA